MNDPDEFAAYAFLHEQTGECQGEHFVPGPDPVNNDPGAEGWRCVVCGETKWYRGPGY